MSSQILTSNTELNKNFQLYWYALRITYSRELVLKEYLDAEGIENFIPMHYIYIVKGERKMRKLVPVVHNLVFVHTTRKQLDEIDNEFDTLRLYSQELQMRAMGLRANKAA